MAKGKKIKGIDAQVEAFVAAEQAREVAEHERMYQEYRQFPHDLWSPEDADWFKAEVNPTAGTRREEQTGPGLGEAGRAFIKARYLALFADLDRGVEEWWQVRSTHVFSLDDMKTLAGQLPMHHAWYDLCDSIREQDQTWEVDHWMEGDTPEKKAERKARWAAIWAADKKFQEQANG